MEPAPSPTPEPHTTSQEDQLPWLVIYTKPRQEKKLAERLHRAGYNGLMSHPAYEKALERPLEVNRATALHLPHIHSD